MASFESIFPTFLQKCSELHELLRVVTFMLFTVGTILFVQHGFTQKTAAFYLVRLLALTALLVYLPDWGNQAQELLQSSILSGLGVDPAHVYDQYNQLLAVKRDLGPERSWWDILGDLNSFTVELLISGILWLIGHFASLLLFWAYVFQKFILFSGYALSPLLIGFMGVPQLRSTGNRYVLHLVGVLLWPLGWAVAALITQGILDFMTDPSLRFIDPTASLYGLQTTFGVVVLAFWILFSTVAAPLVIQKVLASGALAGGPLIAGAFSSLFQTAATTAGAAAVASTTGIPLATFGAAGMAAVLSTLSSAAGHGSACHHHRRKRPAAVVSLGTFGVAAVPALVEALKDQSIDAGVRGLAVTALGTFGPGARAAVSALVEMLKAQNPSLRQLAAFALGKIGPDAKAAVPSLVVMLRDKEPFIREIAGKSLKQIDPGEAAANGLR